MKAKLALVLLMTFTACFLLGATTNHNNNPDPDSLEHYWNLGVSSFDQKDFDQAERYFHNAYNFCQTDCDSIKENIGLAILYQREQAGALKIFKEVARNPNYPEVYRSLGLAHMVYEEWALAILYFNQYLAGFPEDELSLLRRGHCYENLNYPQKAINDFNAAFVRLDKDSSSFRFEVASRLGSILFQEKRFKEAITPLKVANSIKPDVSLHKKIGVSYFQTEKYDSAAFYLIEPDIALPRDYEATLLGAWCQFYLDSITNAIYGFESVIYGCKDKDLIDKACFALVDLYLGNHLIEPAKEALTKVSRSGKTRPAYHFYFGKILFLQRGDKTEVRDNLLLAMEKGLEEDKLKECIKLLSELDPETLSK